MNSKYFLGVIIFLGLNINWSFSQTTFCDRVINQKEVENLNEQLITLCKKVENYQLIILGEKHNYRDGVNTTFLGELLKRYEKVDFIHEVSLSHALLINNYLENGDTTIWKIRDQMHCAYELQLKSLKAIYDESDYKFKVIGLDIDYNFTLSTMLAIRQICLNENITFLKLGYPKEFIQLLYSVGLEDELSEIKRVNTKFLSKVCNRILEGEQKFYIATLGDSYNDFYRILQDVVLGRKLRKFRKLGERERLLYERYKELLIQNPNKKYFGGYGNFHANKEEMDIGTYRYKKFTPFASSLNNDGFKVFTIQTFYGYYPSYERKSWKDFKFHLEGVHRIQEEWVFDFFYDNYQKNTNAFIPIDKYLKGVDFILLLNLPLQIYR